MRLKVKDEMKTKNVQRRGRWTGNALTLDLTGEMSFVSEGGFLVSIRLPLDCGGLR